MIKNKLIMIMFLMMIMFIIPVFAQQQSLGLFKQNDCINLIQICADCTYVNFTSVKYPNSNNALGNVAAQKIGTEFNYTFCNTSQIGIYIVNGVGDVDGEATIFAYDLEVSKTGEFQTVSITILFIIWAFMLLLPFILKIAWLNFFTAIYSIGFGLYLNYVLPSAANIDTIFTTLVLGIGVIYLALYFPLKFGKMKKLKFF